MGDGPRDQKTSAHAADGAVANDGQCRQRKLRRVRSPAGPSVEPGWKHIYATASRVSVV